MFLTSDTYTAIYVLHTNILNTFSIVSILSSFSLLTFVSVPSFILR